MLWESRLQMLAYIEVLKQHPICDINYVDYNNSIMNNIWYVVSLGSLKGIDHYDEDCKTWLKQVHRFGIPNPFIVFIDYVCIIVFTPIEMIGQHVGMALYHITKHFNVVLQIFIFIMLICCFIMIILSQVNGIFNPIAIVHKQFTRRNIDPPSYRSLKQV